MGRQISKPPSEVFMVRMSTSRGEEWEGPYATHAAAKGRKSYWENYGYGYPLEAHISKATVSEWEEI